MAIRVGIVGARRGRGLAAGLQAVPDCRVTAVCDLKPERRSEAAEQLQVEHLFEDYERMLGGRGPHSGLIDAVVVATPQNLHVEHAVAALERDLHVLSEVPAEVSIGLGGAPVPVPDFRDYETGSNIVPVAGAQYSGPHREDA